MSEKKTYSYTPHTGTKLWSKLHKCQVAKWIKWLRLFCHSKCCFSVPREWSSHATIWSNTNEKSSLQLLGKTFILLRLSLWKWYPLEQTAREYPLHLLSQFIATVDTPTMLTKITWSSAMPAVNDFTTPAFQTYQVNSGKRTKPGFALYVLN